jgi:hypothetical protein
MLNNLKFNKVWIRKKKHLHWICLQEQFKVHKKIQSLKQ